MAHPLLAVLLAASGSFPFLSGDELERARELLAKDKEQHCVDGTDLCVKANDVAAVELLLDVLSLDSDRGGFLPSAHYRDVVWDGLRQMTSAEARARVQQELVKNKKSALMRQWCAELLGEYGDAAFIECLTKACDDKELDVRRAAVHALGRLRYPDVGGKRDMESIAAFTARAGAAAALMEAVSDKDPILRANGHEGLARLDRDGHRESFVKALADKDAGVRCALLAVLAELYPELAEKRAAAALSDKDWRPRMQAVDVLATVQTKAAIVHLIDAVDDPRPAVATRAVRHLQERTGQKHTLKEAWEAWWKANGEAFDDAKKPDKVAREQDSTSATFNGIELASDHVAFLIDKSAGMDKLLTSQDCTKDEAARKELEATLSRLQGRLTFSLFTYAEHVTPFDKKGSTELGAKNQEKALAFVEDERLQGQKDIWQALETALSDTDVDTIFLLSSGEPEIGLYVHWNRVTWHLKELNRFRKVVVHAIAYSDEQWYRDQLQKIAEATGGEFKWFE